MSDPQNAPEDMTENGGALPPRRDGLADERDDPQTHPLAEEIDAAEENAATALDQPSEDVG